ncbi:hypothetical protein SEUCBS139899_000361 [Sporothrix eucalyptigena]|uniref:Uncharacterized protein n=1 Tax=Sporothrix eucalyptigena TaxID=1812306 RepID=A0ABP0BDF3_9PEZI
MGDGDLMISPVESDIEIQMGEDDHAFDTNTFPASKPTDKGKDTTEATASGIVAAKALAAAAAKTAASQPPQQPQKPQPPQAPQTSQQPAPAKPAEATVLPRVASIIPAMFVPLDADADLTQPFDPPRSRIERAKAMIDTLGYFRDGVRQGFVYLGDLDRQRIVAETRAREIAIKEARDKAEKAAREAANQPVTVPAKPLGKVAGKAPVKAKEPKESLPLPPNDDESISPDEIDAMLSNMRAPAVPGVDYNMVPTLEQMQAPIPFPPVGNVVLGGRRDAVRQISNIVEQILLQMSGYDAHMVQLRAHWLEVLEREQKLLDDKFGALPGGPSGTATSQADNGGKVAGGIATPALAAAETPDVAMSDT